MWPERIKRGCPSGTASFFMVANGIFFMNLWENKAKRIMQPYKFDTCISKDGIITLPLDFSLFVLFSKKAPFLRQRIFTTY
jgi:hypothetical protein